jgi:hypothetical protein
VVVDLGRPVGGGEIRDVVAAEPQPREKQDEAGYQPGGAPAIGGLLLKQVEGSVVAHALGFIERST